MQDLMVELKARETSAMNDKEDDQTAARKAYKEDSGQDPRPAWWGVLQDEIILYHWRNFMFHYQCLTDCLVLCSVDTSLEWKKIPQIIGETNYTLDIPAILHETYCLPLR